MNAPPTNCAIPWCSHPPLAAGPYNPDSPLCAEHTDQFIDSPEIRQSKNELRDFVKRLERELT